MKINKFKIIILLALLTIVSLKLDAQVVIGSAQLEPEKGMILEIKNQMADATTNVTVNSEGGGVGFPRVMLVSKTTLEPFIANNPTDFTADVKKRHTGMVVYNLNTLTGDFEQGLYVWNGVKWSKIADEKGSAEENRFFYLPSFNIQLNDIANDLTIDLYDIYETQFTSLGNPLFVSSNDLLNFVPSHKNDYLYNRSELDYVVTYYDSSIIHIDNISTTGIMQYDVLSLDLTENSFINIVLVVK